MSDLSQLLEGNRRFAAHFADGEVPIWPRLSTVVLTCLDARVDPAHLLDLQLGDALVIRNAGGRINPSVLSDLAVLGLLFAALPGDKAMTPELVILHHTDCGMSRFAEPAAQPARDRTRRSRRDNGDNRPSPKRARRHRTAWLDTKSPRQPGRIRPRLQHRARHRRGDRCLRPAPKHTARLDPPPEIARTHWQAEANTDHKDGRAEPLPAVINKRKCRSKMLELCERKKGVPS